MIILALGPCRGFVIEAALVPCPAAPASSSRAWRSGGVSMPESDAGELCQRHERHARMAPKRIQQTPPESLPLFASSVPASATKSAFPRVSNSLVCLLLGGPFRLGFVWPLRARHHSSSALGTGTLLAPCVGRQTSTKPRETLINSWHRRSVFGSSLSARSLRSRASCRSTTKPCVG